MRGRSRADSACAERSSPVRDGERISLERGTTAGLPPWSSETRSSEAGSQQDDFIEQPPALRAAQQPPWPQRAQDLPARAEYVPAADAASTRSTRAVPILRSTARD